MTNNPKTQPSALSTQSFIQPTTLSPQSSVLDPISSQFSVLSPQSSIFIAGHRGMVGSAIVRCLRSKGFANIITRTHSELDLIDQHAVREFFRTQSIDYVVLAAARVGGIHANNTWPARFIYENLMIEANIIHEAYQTGVQRLLFLGSSCIYPKMAPQPMGEDCLLTGRLEPTNEPYAVAKIAGIKLCESYNRQYGTRYRSVMPTNLYGPNDGYNLENSHVLPAMIRKFHLGKLAMQGNLDGIRKDEAVYGPIPDDIRNDLHLGVESLESGVKGREPSVPSPQSSTLSPLSPQHSDLDTPSPQHSVLSTQSSPTVRLWGSGTPRREFLHVDDLASACVHVMGLSDDVYAGCTDPLTSHINVGTGEDMTIAELADLIRRIVGFEGDVIWDGSKPDGTPRKLLDVSKLKRLGWTARISLEAGIRHAYDSYLAGYPI